MAEHVSELPRLTAWQIYRQQARARWNLLMGTWQLFRGHPLGMLGFILVVFFALMTITHPVLMGTVWDKQRYDPAVGFDIEIMPHPTRPSQDHLLGTDTFGRDVFSQLLFGARTSFSVGIIAAFVAVTLSTLLGGAAGYYGGTVDVVLMGVADVLVLLPAPVVLLIFGLVVRMHWSMVAFFYGVLAGLGGQSIVVKSQTLVIQAKPYIEAARIAGGSKAHIVRKHILPGLMPIAIVHAVLTVVGAVLTESLLSFFSRTHTYLSWGTMIWMNQGTFRWFKLEGQWHAIVPPALAIMLFCSAFYLVGRALDDVINPRLRKR